jgi:hypothetical protein
MLVDSVNHLPFSMNRAEILRPEAPMWSGIDPETLPKPPKSFT